MAVIEFDIYDEATPNGTPLGTITDEDAELGFEVHWRKPGTGFITIWPFHEKADLIANDRYVKCRVPVISDDPLFGWWMRQGRVDLSHSQGAGALRVHMAGPGTRDILRFARLLENTYAPVPPASAERGSSTDTALWRWVNQHRGAIAARVMEEGINQELGDLLPPLDGVTFDWDRTDDSNGDPWTDDISQIEQRIGIDAESFMQMLEMGGGFTVFAEPNLLFHAYQDYPFRDLTEEVTFQAEAGGSVDPNVASDMARELDSMDRWNAMLVEPLVDYGGDEVEDVGYLEVPSTAEGVRAHIGYVATPVDDITYMESMAAHEMGVSEGGLMMLAAEVDPLQLLPGPDGSNGDYWLYDMVSVQSRDGNGTWDIEEGKHVSAIRFGVRTATDGSTQGRSRRSLRTTVLLDEELPPVDIIEGTPDA